MKFVTICIHFVPNCFVDDYKGVTCIFDHTNLSFANEKHSVTQHCDGVGGVDLPVEGFSHIYTTEDCWEAAMAIPLVFFPNLHGYDLVTIPTASKKHILTVAIWAIGFRFVSFSIR